MKTISSFSSKLLALTLALMASVASFAYEFEYVNDFHIDGFAYKIIDRTEPCAVALIEVADCEKHVTIPESVIYNDTTFIVTTMGMGNIVFSGIAQKTMESLYIPKTIMIINYRALGACPNLMSIVVDEENKYLDSRNNCNAVISSNDTYRPANQLVAGCKTTVIPNSVTEIGNYAFVRCETLENIIIPEGVTTIRDGAFYECTSLSSIKLPESLTQLTQQWIFGGCTSLKEVFFFAKTPPYIAYGMFIGITPTIYVPEESLDAYKKALYWQNFDIQAIPYKSQWCDTWNVMWFDGLFFDETASTSQYILGKDTVIGNYTYSKFTSRTSVRFTNDRKVYVYYEGFDDNDPYSEDLPTGEYLAYDFSAQVGDTLEVFSGVTYNTKTYKCVVYDVQTDPETNLRTIMLHPLRVVDGNGNVEVSSEEITWIEGVGSPRGFLIGTTLPGGGLYALLCAYKDDELKYTGSFYEHFGCEYNAGVVSDDLFPTLSGLQRTICREYYEQADNKTRIEQFTNLTTRTETGGPYIYYSPFLLREEDNKILIYSRSLDKDLVLYDFNLEVGDSLPMLYIDFFAEDNWIADRDMELWCVVDYHKDLEGNILPADTLIVTDVSAITLLDGKEYKKWTFNNGMEYVEGIGSFGNRQWSGDFFQLIANRDVPTSLLGEHLVCASKNKKLLYMMDDAEMERLGAECLCDVEKKWSDTWCNQWNILSHGYLGPQDPLAGARTSIFWLSNNTVNRDGQEYIPLMCSSSKPDVESTNLIGELRFTENKQVYFNYDLDKTEYLLYDFGAQVGDTLELFAGLEFYDYHKTYTHVITSKDTLNDGRLQIQADVIIRIDNGAGEVWEEKHPVIWMEGLGSKDGIIFNSANPGVGGDAAIIMLCAYRDDECVYTTEYSDYKNMGCVYNDGTVDEDLFPMLSGLQRTICNEYCEDSKTSLQKFDEIRFEHDQPYIYCESAFLIREENNKILIYSHSLDKDLVLYDFTLEVGDSLPRLYLDESAEKDLYWIYYNIMNVVDYHKDLEGNILPADTLIVTDVSAITLLDGKEYKKWTFNNGMEYVEGIGSFGNNMQFLDFFQLIGNMAVPVSLHGTHLVCVSKNGKLLYQMDDTEMERLGAECLCEVETSYKSQWCDTWNVFVENGSVYPPHEETYRYQLAQDIVIGDYTYTTVVSKAINDALDAPHYVAAVRFTDDRKVYIYYDNAEYLLYDFNVQEGEELEVFAGINNYTSEIKTYKCTVTGVEQYACVGCPATITLHVPNHPDDITEIYRRTQWQEGVGDVYSGLLNGVNGYVPVDGGGSVHYLLCAYKGDELKYTGMFHENYGCGDDAEQTPEDLFPTLWGLQRTEVEFHTDGAAAPSLMSFNEYTPTLVNGKWYLYDGRNYLREENNQVLLYSPEFEIYEDVVLYDWALEIGDTLPFTIRPFDDDKMRGAVFRVTDVSTITLLDGKEYKKWTLACGIEYIEGIGAINGEGFGNYFCLQHSAHPATYIDTRLVCASRNGKLLYQMDEAEMERLGAECLCEAENPADLFPTLWGLQRTGCTKTIGENGNGTTVWGSRSYLMQEIETATISGKQYLLFGTNNIYDEYCSLWLREENNKILLYSTAQKKDLVLYDFTLNVGDSLPRLYIDYDLSSIVDYDNDEWGLSPLVVTEVSTITLLDGQEHKKWTFNNGMQYVEGIGSFGTCYAHNDFYQLIANAPLYSNVHSQHLVCVSKNNKLLYQMDDAEMEQLETECLCEIEPKWSETWCNQWNILSHGYQGPQYPLVAAHTSIFWLSNNTVNRDGQEYIPLMCSSSKPDVESTNLIGELRFTEDKQVYFYYDNTEYLLYDFDVQVGDTLDIFGGIELYSYSFVEQKTYPHVITKIDTLDDSRLQITSDAIVIFEDSYGAFEEKMPQTWIEGLGSTNGIVYTSINPGIAGDAAIVMLCAYRDDECVYKTDSNDPYWIDYTQLGCVYNEGDFIEGAFPMLSGLQRTVCNEYCGDTEDDNSANNTYKQTFDKIFFENDKPYILCNDFLIREEDNKILIYSQLLNKDLVLYDFTLEVGDSLPALYIDYQQHNAMDWMPYNIGVVDYNKDFDGTIYPADTFVVTDISNVTLLDGKEYKKWTFNNGMEYIEGIGMYGGHRGGNFFGLIQEVVVPCHTGTHLVCVSKNGQLLYQMDDAEMERLGAECLCDYDSGHRKDNAKDGQIGGRPTPTQWNQLEVVLREMDNNHTILQAETFSYTLEDISQQVNNKTYFQLARQSTKDTATTKSVVGALHFGKDEDNRVYFLRDGVEYVLYDFTAEPGDTVEIFAGINNYPQETTYTHVVTGKDTLENGACRMLLEVVFPDDTNTTAENAEKVWLAGLGSVDGIVHNAAKRASNAHAAPNRSADSNETESSVMLCAWREDSCLYTTDHPDYDSFGCVYNQDPTSVENTHSPLPMTNCQKIIRNEQLLILHEGKTYNVLGVQIK